MTFGIDGNQKPALKDYAATFLVLLLPLFGCIEPLTLAFLPPIFAMVYCGVFWRFLNFKKIQAFKPYLTGFLILSALCLLSSLWSIMPDESFSRAVKVSGLALSFFFFLFFILNLSQTSIRFIKQTFFWPLILAAYYLSIELIFGMPILRFFSSKDVSLHSWDINKNVSILMLLLPLGLLSVAMSGQKIFYAVLLIPCALMLVFTESQSSWLAMIAAMIIGGVTYYSSSLLKLFFVGLFAVCLAMPFIAPFMYEYLAAPMGDGILRRTSFSARLEIWDFISKKIFESPLLGFGIDSTRHMTFEHPGHYHVGNTVMHPHNIVLQMWNDFGLFGISIFVGALAVLYRHIMTQDKISMILSGVTIVSLTIYVLVSWSLWASWLLSFVFFLLVIFPIFIRNEGHAKE